MNPDTLARAAHPSALSLYLSQQAMSMHHHEHGAPVESVREAEHDGHHMVIRTTYRVEIDGHAVDLPLGVDNDGHVHCHSLPNYQFNSAIDMVKQVLDSFPGDFLRSRKRAPTRTRSVTRPGMPLSRRRGQAKGK